MIMPTYVIACRDYITTTNLRGFSIHTFCESAGDYIEVVYDMEVRE